MTDLSTAHASIRRWFEGALGVVEPRQAVRSAMAFRDGAICVGDARVPLADGARIVVVAIGKAASGMALGAQDVLGERIDRGFILTKYGHLADELQGFTAFEAGHPTPDESGLSATNEVLAGVSDLGKEDVVIALISGGGSALFESPREGLSLADIQDVTRRLMHAGAGIHDLNIVRKALSRTKGGGMRRIMAPATCVSLLLSDVLGNDPETIASGPTVLSQSGPGDALDVLERYELTNQVSREIMHTLETSDGDGTDPDTSKDVVCVIADNATFVTEIAERAVEEGRVVEHIADPYDGDAAKLGREFVQAAKAAPEDIDVLIRGGEATVEVTGDGVGGRNTEMALAAAMALEGNADWVVASLASDGDDGNSRAAGAIADGGTVRRARQEGIDPQSALAQNDSASIFRAAGGLVETGPTGTNVNDVYIALRIGRAAKGKGLE